jgi:3-isopropylmalate/(R)-2-methylmalate dehydratase small subunit
MTKFSTIITGRAWKYGDEISSDQIFPPRFVPVVADKPETAGKYAFYFEDPEFVKNVSKNDIVVAGISFSCGSSREYSPLSIKYAGAGAVIAKSFSRIFFRNAINIGLPVFTCPDTDKISRGDILEIDLEKARIVNQTTRDMLYGKPLSADVLEILRDGGLVPHTKKILREQGKI